MKNGNHVVLKGRVTANACAIDSQNGKKKIVFSICWNNMVKNNEGERVSEPHYFDCETWFLSEKQANVVLPKIKKGAEIIIIDAHLEKSYWEDKEGKKREKTLIVIDDAVAGICSVANVKKQESKQETSSTE